jgi:hypothetical protein
VPSDEARALASVGEFGKYTFSSAQEIKFVYDSPDCVFSQPVCLVRDLAPSAGFCSVWLVRWLHSFALSDVFYRAFAAHLLRHLAQLNVFWRILR